MNIIVLCGGLSNERDVSLVSGKQAALALRRLGHKAVLVDLFYGYSGTYNKPEDVFESEYIDAAGSIAEDAPDLEAIMKSRGGTSRIGDNVIELCRAADLVFLALHGNDGEDGRIQATLDLHGVKYTGTGSLGSHLAMNKGVAKMVFLENGIRTPEGITVNKNDAEYKNVGFPCVVKPRSGGSSIGTSIVEDIRDYPAALADAFKYDNDVLVERYIKGRECDVGVIAGRALPVIEICPKSGFFDYKNKYQEGMTDEYCPADFDDEITARLQKAAVDVYNALFLEVYARIDFIVDADGNPWCLEANTLPGITPASLMPKEAAAEGMDYDSFCAKIIEESLKKYN